MRSLWTLSLLFITLLAGVSQLTLPPASVRPVVTVVFLLLCPGAALLSFYHLENAMSELVLSVALSLALVTLTAELTVLLGLWSLEVSFWFLFALSLPGTVLRLLRADRPLEYTPE